MNRLFRGFFFVALDFELTLGTADFELLPDFIGYVLMMKGMIQTRMYGVCDRCASEFERDIEIPIDVILVTELANEDNEDEWVFPLEGDSADLEDIVRTVFVLNMGSKLLCKDDCKGLCCRCGKNLNEGPCSCQKELDPRFAALRQLLDKKSQE